mmetsp:Transcript_7329/g.9601  ORF Transcript_7329/g.9601 Transcript_7329/m.9601 type:complete len:575 (-) Transcript_7329:558-2282(-)|eukprot:CAMPEP_0204837220 /NCGR_PEP_ID=MMETSP1346-20131115/27298_1 /ASSEMBLY_ACC=CAM_ASM_000771 /TAXON_ID=215587 /ORGANISM="Aplanochytrium stocchinoi, Strain GSBS06" /LENGTH=574 /DNA_ID=CAMNT_0051972523 /DNA_START=82 /DNA_END=1806 /DNA_ORIENTATION=+
MGWWRETTIYQIYPRSFCDSNGDGIGDIPGIVSKLDYLKDLGVETLWLSPIFDSPQEDHGYDISDYTSINPEYGTMEDVEELIDGVHERDMKIVFDMVMNHTSDQHQWFKDSILRRNGKDDWYIWQDNQTIGGCISTAPNNWRSMLGNNGWVYNEHRKQSYFASFLPFQPDLNYRNPEVKNAMLNVVKFWMDKRVDGFRLDIFNVIYKDPGFGHNPFTWRLIPSHEEVNGFFQNKKNTVNHPDTIAFAKELRNFVDNESSVQKHRFLLGEVMGKPDMLKAFMGDSLDPGLNLVFMFETLDFDFKAKYFDRLIRKFEDHYPSPDYTPVIVFSNHDIRRMVYRLNGHMAKVKVVATLQMTLRGVPCIYYGEEIGMTEGNIRLYDAQDPVAKLYRPCVPQFLYDSSLLKNISMNRDNCRTPMQWSSDGHGGFIMNKYGDGSNKASMKGVSDPWLPVNDDSLSGINVESQEDEEHSMLMIYRNLLALRKSEPALFRGDLKLHESVNNLRGLLCYERVDTETQSRLFVLINFKTPSNSIFDSSVLSDEPLKIVFSTDKRNIIDQHKVNLYGPSALILRA